jgi:hypothetical protein
MKIGQLDNSHKLAAPAMDAPKPVPQPAVNERAGEASARSTLGRSLCWQPKATQPTDAERWHAQAIRDGKFRSTPKIGAHTRDVLKPATH